MTDRELELFKNYEYRIMHLGKALKDHEQRLMNLRKGHQILLRVVKFQTPRRKVAVAAYRHPNRIYKEYLHLRSLFNSERYQLYYSYYNTAKTLEAKINNRDRRSERRFETLKRINRFSSRRIRKVRFTPKRHKGTVRDDLVKLKDAYANVRDIMAYLETGQPPRPKRDLLRRSRTQLEVVFSEIPNWKIERLLGSKKKVISKSDTDLTAQTILSYYLGQLSEREREAYILHHGQGLPANEVARLMRCKTGTVDQLLFRARRTIEITLQNGGPPPTLF